MNDKNKTLSLESSLNKTDVLKGEEDEHEHGEHVEHEEHEHHHGKYDPSCLVRSCIKSTICERYKR